MNSLTPKVLHIILPQMSSTNQYQPLLSDVPVMVVGSLPSDDTHFLLDLITQKWHLPLSSMEHPDIHWLNPEESLKIETVRELQVQAGYKPYSAPVSCYILSQLETASLPAQQALLKILEEPPSHVRIILLTRSISGLLPTILSRCQLVSQTSTDVQDFSEIISWYQQLQARQLGELVEVADALADKADAQATAEQLLKWLHYDLTTDPQGVHHRSRLRHLQLTQEFLIWMEQNVNLKLATTEWLFQLHATAKVAA